MNLFNDCRRNKISTFTIPPNLRALTNMDSNNSTNPKKAPFDPGWNDPPTLSYSAQQPQGNKPRNFLNKRVAFPLSSNNVSLPTNTPSMCLPPSGVHEPPRIPIEINNIIDTGDNLNNDSENVLKDLKDIILGILESSSELGVKAKDIEKRIKVMEEMWINGKLNQDIQLKMKELCYALKDNQHGKADDIHRALMVDHVSSVSSWMPAIKQLVYHCKAKSELLAIESDDL